MIDEHGQLRTDKQYYSGPFKNLLSDSEISQAEESIQARLTEIEFSWELLDYWIRAINEGKFTFDAILDEVDELFKLRDLEKWQPNLPSEVNEVMESLFDKYHSGTPKPFNWENLTIAIEVLDWLKKNPSAMFKLKKDNAGVDQMIGECVDMVYVDVRQALNNFLDTFKVKEDSRVAVSKMALMWSLNDQPKGYIIELVMCDIRALLVPIDAVRELLHYQLVKELMAELDATKSNVTHSVIYNSKDARRWSLHLTYTMYGEEGTNPIYMQGIENPWKGARLQPRINSNIWE